MDCPPFPDRDRGVRNSGRGPGKAFLERPDMRWRFRVGFQVAHQARFNGSVGESKEN
jgi:hypothetical protein